MNILVYYITTLSIFVSSILNAAEKKNLLQDGFASVAVSNESIEALYVQVIEKNYASYAQLGADWNIDGYGNDTMLAGLQEMEEQKILFIKNDPVDNMSDIAFEDVFAKDRIKLLKSDEAEINEAIIFSYIQPKYVDPRPFNVNLD